MEPSIAFAVYVLSGAAALWLLFDGYARALKQANKGEREKMKVAGDIVSRT